MPQVSAESAGEMLLPGAPRRDGAGDAAERSRSVRERLGAAVSGLSELELLRQRQEVLVRAALERREERREEKLLEENILLLRKQLSCLRMRDAGLISQLQELDRQINDLRLDTEPSHDQPEADSRPSSGFYELSDAASASLSNSSNSVFSECFCTTADADGRLPSSNGPADCLECDGLVGGLCDDSSFSGTIHRSLSALYPPTVDAASLVASSDTRSKYLCDLVTWNGSETYHFPSPLHAPVVQSPALLQGYGGQGRDEAGTPETSSPPVSVVPQSSSWPALSSTQTTSYKRLDSYIYSLLQRRAQPVRTGRPRTSISTEPSKSILRQASLCARQLSGPGPGLVRGSELKPSPPAGGTSVEGVAIPSAQRQRSLEGKGEEQEIQNVFPGGGDCSSPHGSINKYNDSLLRKRSKGLLPHIALLPRDFRELSSPKANSSPMDTNKPCCPPDQELHLEASNPAETKNNHRSLQAEESCRVVLELDRQRSSKQSQDDRGGSHMVHRRFISTQQRCTSGCIGGSRNVKHTCNKEPSSGKRGVKSHLRSKKSRLPEDGSSTHIRVSRRSVSSRMKRPPASIPEGRVLDRQASGLGSMRPGVFKCYHHGNHHHHHHHGRDQVVVIAKPKYKRSEYCRLRAPPEALYEEAFRRVQLRHRKEPVSGSTVCPPSSSPYSYTAGSDSEYSAECASLFHSTIVDTSEDERSNYTTNCFGDSESSEEEYVESTTTGSDTEESGGGGAGGGAGAVCRGRGPSGAAGAGAAGQERIKASRNLKKKILRFRSGSLKLMTTV
ncbi:dapper homolog 1-like isoform X1 [Parambassis ranga]|uniref:Dapper homolog 1-like isoform X1 n=1 Tax=Parambassis ranga TaxID=210632 RepID=A0A6P7HMW2_9TELE|nr:dapper homolog 1-like isoform X1 [Parambassis ranga]